MKILKIELSDFCSYKNIELVFVETGLVVIQGANGSGKSTLCDAIPWILFGKTAKGGAVDDVKSWFGGDAKGTAVIEHNGEVFGITRQRGKTNDLIFEGTRGKDLADTQKLINTKLGMDCDTYLACAYVHEFNATSQFFVASAKSRRETTERMVDLSLSIRLQESTKAQTKKLKIEIERIQRKLDFEIGIADSTARRLNEAERRNLHWLSDQKAKEDKLNSIISAMTMSDVDLNDQIKETEAGIAEQRAVCEHCGAKIETKELKELRAHLITLETQRTNHRIANLRVKDAKIQLAELKMTRNTYGEDVENYTRELELNFNTVKELRESLESEHENLLQLDLLSDSVDDLRAELIENTVKDLESRTNQLMYDHFEGTIQVEFTGKDNDKLDVSIQKDGNECNYSQLSKGQRQVLKLCFGVAVMKIASEYNGLKFSQIFFDEALDGMDDANKLKAVRMLETLASEDDTVFLVEHSEAIRAMATQKYNVELVDGKSQLTMT